ncbi:MAG: hypothetical protein COS35_04790 [Zetaproteobacteria bacterium CG02_land_8_20_14_3_00_50_9]|nr:MAG: hypothetical protein AUJ57_02335 [Zetaproteobacteria bacterium CG1_02_53_45]PIQ32373.1 MAG: hypothetical protein COW62_07725 [Zetaproteobacteria bacterium CG17_big_fil_post_rev_8_21_14_2_50_50_13]PIV30795.1 MAG: hypothetical protein COS35_04790 [Zetaproteobacteria bacterium CG02_land_8_20_14_3_00_50_9]PIY54685.1 MAG: hypothetical protein COZ00_13395 [Zetaproteobacteria bacterium CG_4_10_14_0_8_um_filter_49_80]
MKLVKLFLFVVAVMVGVAATQSAALAADAAEGEKIYKAVCIHCHMSDGYEEKFGPGLKDIMQRVDVAWVDQWLKNPAEMLKTDEYAKSLRETNAFDFSMPTLPDMQDDEKRANVIEYLKTL